MKTGKISGLIFFVKSCQIHKNQTRKTFAVLQKFRQIATDFRKSRFKSAFKAKEEKNSSNRH